MSDHSHLHVRKNGVIYTTVEDLLSDPKVREDIRKTCEIIEEVIERKKQERSNE